MSVSVFCLPLSVLHSTTKWICSASFKYNFSLNSRPFDFKVGHQCYQPYFIFSYFINLSQKQNSISLTSSTSRFWKDSHFIKMLWLIQQIIFSLVPYLSWLFVFHPLYSLVSFYNKYLKNDTGCNGQTIVIIISKMKTGVSSSSSSS